MAKDIEYILHKGSWKAVFHLNLEKRWFDMTLAGIKTEEYRDVKPSWNRVFTHNIKIKGKYFHPTDVVFRISNGYKPDRRQFDIECLSLCRLTGKEEWGAEPGEYYHTLKWGEIISTKNC